MNQELTPKSLIYKNENKYFWLVLMISIISYISLAISIVGILLILGMFAISLFLHALMIGRIRTNAVKLSARQFPEVYQKTKELCENMEIAHVPDIYVMESSGTLNAFATRFFGRNMVVVYSEIFELIERNADDELTFVIAHELAHIKRRHISKLLFILPAMWIPSIAELYLRACEYTCDRYAAYYIGNTEAAKNSLTILAVGKALYKHVDRSEYLEQINSEKGFFVWLSEILSTHPPLPKRIHEISMFFGEAEQDFITKKTSKVVWIWVTTALLAFGLVIAGSFYVIDKFSNFNFLGEFEESLAVDEETPPMIDAVVKGDISKVKSFVENGEDLHVEDYQGFTPLHWAVQDGNKEMIHLLLNAGADPNYEDYVGMTPLMSAADLGDTDLVKMLIEAGGDPNYQEMDGMTPLFYAVFSESVETVTLLLDLGADPTIKDSENMTALMHAIQLGNRDIINLLKKAS